MTGGCHQLRTALGAHALGGLDPDERRRVELHVASCAACRRELDELTEVVATLSGVEPGDLRPDPELFGRVVAAIDRPAPAGPAARRRIGRWSVVAAAVSIVAGGALALTRSGPTPSATASGAGPGGVHMAVSAHGSPSGTVLDLVVGGLPGGERCHLVASAADGSLHDAGSWRADYEGQARIVETTDVARPDLRRLVLYGPGGQPLVSVGI